VILFLLSKFVQTVTVCVLVRQLALVQVLVMTEMCALKIVAMLESLMESVCTLVTHQVVMMEITAPKIFVIQKVVAISLLQQDQATFQAIPLA
jgi:hypothetical protein